MEAVSWLVIGTLHYPKYLGEDIVDCLDKIVKNRIVVERGEYLYTLCHVQTQANDKFVVGEMVKLTRESKEKYFDPKKWEPIEYEMHGKRLVISSRFLLGQNSIMVIEHKRPSLPRSTFANMLKELLSRVIDDPVFTLDVTFHKNPTEIQTFIKEQDQILSISLSNILLKNPTFERRKIKKAEALIKEIGMTRGKLENPETGINKQGEVFEGFVGLAEQGQLDMTIQGRKDADRPGTKRTLATKQRILIERIEIEGDLKSFTKAAWAFLKKHQERFHE